MQELPVPAYPEKLLCIFTLLHKTLVMTPFSVEPPLRNLQMEMLKSFATKVSNEDLTVKRDMIARYLLEKARDEADRIWDERGYTDEKLQQLLEKK